MIDSTADLTQLSQWEYLYIIEGSTNDQLRKDPSISSNQWCLDPVVMEGNWVQKLKWYATIRVSANLLHLPTESNNSPNQRLLIIKLAGINNSIHLSKVMWCNVIIIVMDKWVIVTSYSQSLCAWTKQCLISFGNAVFFIPLSTPKAVIYHDYQINTVI